MQNILNLILGLSHLTIKCKLKCNEKRFFKTVLCPKLWFLPFLSQKFTHDWQVNSIYCKSSPYKQAKELLIFSFTNFPSLKLETKTQIKIYAFLNHFSIYFILFVFAHQTRIFAIFTSADKSYLTHPYPTRRIDKQVAQRATIAHLSPMCQGQISFHKTYKWAMETGGPKSNSSELLCLSWLPATLMMIRSKMNELACRHHFPIISLWEIFQTSRAANSVVSGPIWPKFELVRDFMHILVTCKYKKDRIKSNREKVETSFSPL